MCTIIGQQYCSNCICQFNAFPDLLYLAKNMSPMLCVWISFHLFCLFLYQFYHLYTHVISDDNMSETSIQLWKFYFTIFEAWWASYCEILLVHELVNALFTQYRGGSIENDFLINLPKSIRYLDTTVCSVLEHLNDGGKLLE